MKKEKAILISALFALTMIVVAVVEIRTHAQSPASPVTQSPAPTTQSPMPGLPDAPNSVDIQGRSRYLVGPGDLLDVRVFGQPDLNSTVEIDDEEIFLHCPFWKSRFRRCAVLRKTFKRQSLKLIQDT